MAGPARRHTEPLPARLDRLQRLGRLAGGAPFSSVPPARQTPIEQVLDAAGDLKSVVLLGFTRDGCHLVSYTTQPVAAADGAEGHCLQLWSFQPGQRCRRLWSMPLFRTQPYLDSLQDEEDFMPGMVADDLLLTVAEAPDSSLLVVHGRSADPAEASSRDHHLPNFLTVVPGPLHAGAAQLQVAHLSYHTSFPHAPFNPYLCLIPLDASGPLEAGCGSLQTGMAGGNGSGISRSADLDREQRSSSCGWPDGRPLAVALYTGDGVRFAHFVASRQQGVAQAQPAGRRMRQAQQQEPDAMHSEDDEGRSSASHLPSPEPSSQPSQPSGSSSPAASPLAGQRTALQPPSSLQQEQVAAAAWRAGSSPASSRADSPFGSPWQRRRQRQRQAARQEQPAAVPEAGGGEQELGSQLAFVPCAHADAGMAAGRPGRGSGRSSSRGDGSSSTLLAAVSLAATPQHLDLEACLFAALRQQGLPPAALVDYAAAPVQTCVWGGQEGLLLLAVLRLLRPTAAPGDAEQRQQQGQQQHWQQPRAQPQQQPEHRSACVLLHAGSGDGAASLVEWLEPPYPWHNDLAAFLVQQTAFAGLAFEKAPAFFADFLSRQYGGGQVPPRWRLPLVLTNRSTLGGGASLPFIAHPWLPQAILGYGSKAI